MGDRGSATPYAHEVTSDVTIDGETITPAIEGRSFTAIRYSGLAAGAVDAAETDTATTTSGRGEGRPVRQDPSESTSYGCALGHRRAKEGSGGAAVILALALALVRRRRGTLQG